MKFIPLLLIGLVLFALPAAAQKAKKEYVNASFEKVKKNDAVFYRMIKQNPDKTWHVDLFKVAGDVPLTSIDYKTKKLIIKHGLERIRRYGKLFQDQEYVNNVKQGVYRIYSSNETIEKEGYYHEGLKHGEWKMFTSNSKPMWISIYHNDKHIARTKAWNGQGIQVLDGHVKDGEKDGLWTTYYHTGEKKEIFHFEAGKAHGINKEWFKNGKLEEEVEYYNGRLQGPFKQWYESGILKEEGAYELGAKTGVWTQYFTDGEVDQKLDYSARPIKKVFISERREKLDLEVEEAVQIYDIEEIEMDEEEMEEEMEEEPNEVIEETVFFIVEEQAEPEGGMKKFIGHISKYVQKYYPMKAKEAGIKGRVFISFIIERDGTPSTFKILRGLGNGCDKVAIEAVKSYGKWKPAKQRGKRVRQQFNLPVKFDIK